MKVLLSWLREFVSIGLDVPALCERLTMGGLVVDGVEEPGAAIRGVLVGELISTDPHAHAERLTRCEVRTGPGPTVSVVCGATNMKAGDRVAYAPPGTVLPGASSPRSTAPASCSKTSSSTCERRASRSPCMPSVMRHYITWLPSYVKRERASLQT